MYYYIEYDMLYITYKIYKDLNFDKRYTNMQR